jgi:hypothetical protein
MNRASLIPLLADLTVAAPAAERRRGSEGAPAGAPAAAPTAPAGSLEAFALVTERNIFNPNRTARTRAAPEEKPVRTEEVALVGVVGFGASTSAVVHSADPHLKGEAAAGARLGEFTVVAVSPSAVELRAGERTYSLAVAQRLTRVEGGEWTVLRGMARVLEIASPELEIVVEVTPKWLALQQVGRRGSSECHRVPPTVRLAERVTESVAPPAGDTGAGARVHGRARLPRVRAS